MTSRVEELHTSVTCTTLCCAGLVTYFEATMREHALRIYRRDGLGLGLALGFVTVSGSTGAMGR